MCPSWEVNQTVGLAVEPIKRAFVSPFDVVKAVLVAKQFRHDFASGCQILESFGQCCSP